MATPSTVPISIHNVEDRLKLIVDLSLLEHWQIVAKRPETLFEVGVIESTSSLFVVVSKHEWEIPQLCLRYSRSLLRLDLLLQILLHTLAQLFQLIPLLVQPDRAVFRVPVVKDYVHAHLIAYCLDGLEFVPPALHF